MARKREDHTPSIRSQAKSGWCIDRLHNDCKGTFTWSDCNCDCHSTPLVVQIAQETVDKTQETQNASTPVASIAPKRRGRPPKVEATPIPPEQDPRPWRRK